MNRDVSVHLPPGVEALDKPVVSTFCKEIDFTGGLSAAYTTAHWDGNPGCVQDIVTAHFNKASPIPRPFGLSEAAGCRQLRAVCKVAFCWHQSGKAGCPAPCSRPFINEGIRDEGNLLSERGMVVKIMLTCLSVVIRSLPRHYLAANRCWLLLITTSARGTFPLAPAEHKKLFARLSFLHSVGSLFQRAPSVSDVWWGGSLVHGCIWGLETWQRQRKGAASCVAEHEGCCAFCQGQGLHSWGQYMVTVLEDVEMLEHLWEVFISTNTGQHPRTGVNTLPLVWGKKILLENRKQVIATRLCKWKNSNKRRENYAA